MTSRWSVGRFGDWLQNRNNSIREQPRRPRLVLKPRQVARGFFHGGASMASDWKTISNDKEKYAAYLCSREWAVKREEVRDRAHGKCERCQVLPMDACHHLTYKRKFEERIEDLQAICTPCHEFTHGKDDFDPAEHQSWFRYLQCVPDGVDPVPSLDDGIWKDVSMFGFTRAIEILHNEIARMAEMAIDPNDDNSVFHAIKSGLRGSQRTIQEEVLGFDYASWIEWGKPQIKASHYEKSLALLGAGGQS